MLNKKNITKLLNADKRHAIISSVSLHKRNMLKSAEYARYVVDSQILHRNPELENDKNSSYGFSPINFLCAVTGDNIIKNRIFEFNIVNHFLHLKEGENACEVVEAILLMWKAEDKSIINFDPDIIDQYLADIEKSYKESQIDEAENITESDNA
jgi:hypothetical protein